MEQLVEKLKINTTFTLLSGMHIGGSKDTVEIGGIDLPVIKLESKNGQPYIPGSSLKGKMRCLLEQSFGVAEPGEIGREYQEGFMDARDLFGYATGKESKPSRLIVRDSMMTEESEKALRENRHLDAPYLEYKTENNINRLTGSAENPRTTERVPAGAVFNVEFLINIFRDISTDYDYNGDVNNLPEYKLFQNGLNLLEKDYLGGSGSRGYGEIKVGKLRIERFNSKTDWK